MNEVYCQEVIICNIARRGEGVVGDPIRIITQVFTKDGELIAEKDPCEGQELDEKIKWLSECRKVVIKHVKEIQALTTTLSLIRPLAFADHSSVEYNMEEIRKILNNVK